MTPTTQTISGVQCSYSDGNCGTIAAVPYFLSFVIIVSIILINMFTAVIIEVFEAIHLQV